ncbi:hypothetical protein FB566_2729 [Stackebrandtia endophytica]|uniref:Uncharacterized protein n=1 Tax=Stackebrandtia endophytica TaxID=1496996 RepID=A0A543AX72_9ACTN|nr:hypothetical protein [Stackebrandtia endophytica]TQL77178.1 hypothetical protein FB566_2729 [Stackebrandtia endophytica]
MADRETENWQAPREDVAEQAVPVAEDDDVATDEDSGFDAAWRGEADVADVAEQSRDVPDEEYRDG